MKLVIVPAAFSELQRAAAYYALHGNAQLALEFVAEFERATKLIRAAPQLGAVFRGSYRRFALRRFPYTIIYRTLADELRVLAVAHQKRRPGYWSKRT